MYESFIAERLTKLREQGGGIHNTSDSAVTIQASGTVSAVPPGNCTISVSMAGYADGVITGVSIGYDDVPDINA